MTQFYDEQLDITNGRLKQIEKNMAIMQENIYTVAEQIKETQMFLIKLAKNQSEITKRISQWPYIPVPERGNDELY